MWKQNVREWVAWKLQPDTFTVIYFNCILRKSALTLSMNPNSICCCIHYLLNQLFSSGLVNLPTEKGIILLCPHALVWLLLMFSLLLMIANIHLPLLQNILQISSAKIREADQKVGWKWNWKHFHDSTLFYFKAKTYMKT